MANEVHSVNTFSQTDRQGSTTGRREREIVSAVRGRGPCESSVPEGVKVDASTEHSMKLPMHASGIRACRQAYGTNAPASFVCACVCGEQAHTAQSTTNRARERERERARE
jgi:hypothetical protein